MQHYAAFHQGLHCLLRLKQPSGTEIHHNLENSTYDPLKHTMDNPYLLFQNVWENPSEYKWVKGNGSLLYHTSNAKSNWTLDITYIVSSIVT